MMISSRSIDRNDTPDRLGKDHIQYIRSPGAGQCSSAAPQPKPQG